MKQVLVYENRKADPTTWDISSAELKSKAFLELFKCLKDEWQVYEANYWGENAEEQKRLYKLACDGDAKAAEQLLTMRKDYEYEEWHISR